MTQYADTPLFGAAISGRKDAIREAIAASLCCMGTPYERRARIGQRTQLADARIWHRLSRSGGIRGGEESGVSEAQCAAWAILYRAAYYGNLPELRAVPEWEGTTDGR